MQDMKMAEKTRDHHLEDSSIVDRQRLDYNEDNSIMDHRIGDNHLDHKEDSGIVDHQRLDDNEDNSIMDHRIGDNHLDHKEDSGIVDHQRLDDNEDNSIMDHRIGDNHLDHKEDSGIVDHQRLDDNEDNSIMDHRIGDNHLDHKEDSGIDRQCLDHKEDNSFVVHHLDHKEDSGIVDRQRLDDNEDNSIMDHRIGDNHLDHKEDSSIVDRQRLDDNEDNSIVDRQCLDDNEDNSIMDHRIDNHLDHKEDSSIVDRQRLDDNEDNSIMDHRIGDNHLDHKEDSSIVDRQRLDDNEDNSIEDRQCLDDNEDNSIMDHRIDNHLDHKEDSSIVDRQCLDDSEDNSIEDRQCLDDNEDMLAAILCEEISCQRLDDNEDNSIVDRQCLDDNEDNSIMDHRIGDNHLDHKEDSGIDRQCLDPEEDNSFVVHHPDWIEGSSSEPSDDSDEESKSIVYPVIKQNPSSKQDTLHDNLASKQQSSQDNSFVVHHLDHEEDPDWIEGSSSEQSDDSDEESKSIVYPVIKQNPSSKQDTLHDNLASKQQSSQDDDSPPVYSLNSTCENIVQTKRNIKPDDRNCDEINPRIFTKAYKQNSNNQKSKHGRSYDRVHACFYCQKLMTNIQTHHQHKHRNEMKMKIILDLKRQIDEEDGNDTAAITKKMHNLQTLLRNKGDNNHNRKVIFATFGEILLSRRKNSDKFKIKDYGPCPGCEEWIVLEHISKHRNKCPSNEKSTETKGSLILQSRIMSGKISTSASTKLRKEVFSSMIRDNITEIAQGDGIITALGEIWLMKNVGNRLRRKNFTSFRMRLSARLLILLRDDADTPSAPMNYFLVPQQFERVTMCALKACDEDDNQDMKNPSTGIKLGYDLCRLANIKLGLAIKSGDQTSKSEACDFLKLLSMEWSFRVTKLARVTLDERHFNKRKELPHPDDIEKLATYLITEINKLELSIIKCDAVVFRETVILTEARLLLYNRRRPGELESLSIAAYESRSTSLDDADMALRNSMTEFERMLVRTQDLVEIRGKAGRGVPVIIPNEVRKPLRFLAHHKARQQGGIRAGNIYMFANTGEAVVRAGDALDEVKRRADLKYPERIYANNLRKHTATIVQALNLDDNELKWVCNHLGHTLKVHDQYYRQTSGLIERIDIAKLMLIQERNLVGRFANKKLSEIQFEDLEVDAVAEDCAVAHKDDDDFLDEGDLLGSERTKRKESHRIKWSKEDEEELSTLFPAYFSERTTKTCPSRNECLQAIATSRENNGKVHTRKWETIKKKINNMMLKKRNI